METKEWIQNNNNNYYYYNERVVVQLRKRREADTVVAEVERRVYGLQEHVADDPESCHL